jgi:hypothetical protein
MRLVRHDQIFSDSHPQVTADELLLLARKDALLGTYRSVGALVRAVEQLAETSDVFSVFVEPTTHAAATFSLRYPNIELLNVASQVRREAVQRKLHDDLLLQLQAVSYAQDRLDEACYIVRQYAKRRENAAVFAAATRLGCWPGLERLARTITLEAAMCVDLTVPARLAADTNCDPGLLRALSRIPLSDALAAAVSVAHPQRA